MVECAEADRQTKGWDQWTGREPSACVQGWNSLCVKSALMPSVKSTNRFRFPAVNRSDSACMEADECQPWGLNHCGGEPSTLSTWTLDSNFTDWTDDPKNQSINDMNTHISLPPLSAAFFGQPSLPVLPTISTLDSFQHATTSCQPILKSNNTFLSSCNFFFFQLYYSASHPRGCISHSTIDTTRWGVQTM